MQSATIRVPHIYTQCTKRLWQIYGIDSSRCVLRCHSQATAQHKAREQDEHSEGSDNGSRGTPEKGAMSRRLEDMTEESVLNGGRGARKSMEDAGFSEELKETLLAKLEDGKFRLNNISAFTEVNMPVRCPLQLGPYTSDSNQRQMPVSKQETLLLLNHGKGRRAWKTPHYGCSMMLISLFVARVLVKG